MRYGGYGKTVCEHIMHTTPANGGVHTCVHVHTARDGNQNGGNTMKNEHGYKRDVYVYNTVTRTVGIIRDVNDGVYPPLCRVFYGYIYGHSQTDWTSARELDILPPDSPIPCSIRRKHGKGAPVLHIDATGMNVDEIESDVQEMRRVLRSAYVSHSERMRKTKHRHVVGTCGEFFPHAGPHVAGVSSKWCVVESHDTCYTWSGYTDPYYTIMFEDGSYRKWVRGSQIVPYPNQEAL